MAQIIAPGVARFTLVGSANDGSYWNVIWDARILAEVGDDRAEVCSNYAGHLMTAWADDVAPVVCGQFALTSVRFIDLDSEDGATGEVNQNSGGQAGPFPGTRVGEGLSLNTAALVTKLASGGRQTRNGRLFSPGHAENEAGVATWNEDERTDIQTAWRTFWEDTTDPSTTYSALPTVVHTRNAGTPANPDIVYVSNTLIRGISVEPRLATQRRRLRRG